MGLFKTFECLKCGHRYEGILDVCSRCGARAAPLSGITSCLASGRPPGYAGGVNTPHSARSYDRAFESNFKTMGITNLTHSDGVPLPTWAKGRGSYNTMPSWAGHQEPIRAYAGLEAMRKAGINLPAMTVEGKPFELPQVHPITAPGQKVGDGLSAEMKSRTVITHRAKQ